MLIKGAHLLLFIRCLLGQQRSNESASTTSASLSIMNHGECIKSEIDVFDGPLQILLFIYYVRWIIIFFWKIFMMSWLCKVLSLQKGRRRSLYIQHAVLLSCNKRLHTVTLMTLRVKNRGRVSHFDTLLSWMLWTFRMKTLRGILWLIPLNNLS